jgi:hypothetical protein
MRNEYEQHGKDVLGYVFMFIEVNGNRVDGLLESIVACPDEQFRDDLTIFWIDETLKEFLNRISEGKND